MEDLRWEYKKVWCKKEKVQVEACEQLARKKTLNLYFKLKTAFSPCACFEVVLVRNGRAVSHGKTNADGIVRFVGKPLAAYSLVSKTTKNTLMMIPLPMPGKPAAPFRQGDNIIAESNNLLERQQYAQALAVLRAARLKIKGPERRPGFYLNLSRAFEGCGDKAQAKRALSRGIRAVRKRQAVELLCFRAALYIKEKRWEQAYLDVQAGLAINNKDPDLHGAKVLAFSLHPLLAIQAYERSRRSIGKSANAAVALFHVLKRNGLGETGKEFLAGFASGLNRDAEIFELLAQLRKADFRTEARAFWARNRRSLKKEGDEWKNQGL